MLFEPRPQAPPETPAPEPAAGTPAVTPAGEGSYADCERRYSGPAASLSTLHKVLLWLRLRREGSRSRR
ncbi:MAG TPA: hypothetical protein PK413_07440 [Thermoanaerobaculia bacterium]|nr:hypothetical protein [Thermoanaerobaculia bacterium]